MSNCLWTFETLTTTGLEADVDTISGVSILAGGGGSTALPVPTVPGQTGNGRLLCSAGTYMPFATDRVAPLLHTSGNPVLLDFLWRPLFDPTGVDAGSQMLQAGYHTFLSPSSIGLRIYTEATVGLYTFRFALAGFYFAGPTNVDFTGIPLTLRDWNHIVVEYDGATTITLMVNETLEGTVTTDFAMVTSTTGQLLFDLFPSDVGALVGVIDTVSLEVS